VSDAPARDDPRPVEAVAFDLDDTLAVPDRDRATILRDAVEATGAPAITREEYRRAHRRNLTADSRTPVFADLLAERGSDVDPAELAREYHDSVVAALSPVAGVEALLSTLGERYAVGLLTNGPVRAQREKIDALSWWDRFDAVAITGELPAGKPDPRAFEALLADLGVPADRTVYVGDDPEADVAGARSAGLRAVHVLGPGDEPHPDADATVRRSELSSRLPAVVEELASGTE